MSEVVLAASWRARRTLAERWLVDHRAALETGRALVWVDSRPLARWLNEQLAAQLGLLLPLPVRTTTDLGRQILQRAGVVSVRVGPGELAGYVSAALAGDDPRLRDYAPFRARPATCRALAETLAMLRAEEPDPTAWFDLWGAAVPHRERDLQALAALEEVVHALLTEDREALVTDLNLQAAGRLGEVLDGQLDAVLLYDLHGLDRSGRELLRALLAAEVGETLLVLPGEPEPQRDCFGAARRVAAVAAAAGLTVRPLPAESDTLYQPDVPGLRPRYRQYRVPTMQRGLEELFRRLTDLLRQGEVRPSQIAVVVPDLPAWAPAIHGLAQRTGVPVAVIANSPRALTGPAAELAELLRVTAERLPRRAVLDLLRRSASPALDQRWLDQLDAASLAAGIEGGDWPAWQTELEQLRVVRGLLDVPDDEAIDAALSALGVLSAQLALVDQATAREHHARVAAQHRWLTGRPATDRVQPRGLDAPDESASDDPTLVLGVLDAWPDTPLSYTDYARLALDLLSAQARPDQPVPGKVLVTRPGELCGAAPQIVYLVGAVTGTFPAPSRAAVPLDVFDLEDMELGGGARVAGQGWSKAALALLELATAADELVLLEPVTDGRGDAVVSSPLIEELVAAGECLETWRLRAEDRATPTPELRQRYPEPTARLAAAVAELAPAVGTQRGEVLHAALIEVGRLAGDPVARTYDGDLSGTAVAPEIAARYGPARPLSASRLETYAKWRFQLFLADLLGLDEQEEPTFGVAPQTEGRVMHALLCQSLSSGRVPATAEAMRLQVEAAAEELLPDSRRLPGVGWGLWRRLRQRLIEFATAMLTADLLEHQVGPQWPTDRQPRRLEQRFGLPGGWPELRLGEGEQSVALRGVIDRLDETPEGWVLLDYKRTLPTGRDALGEATFQLPVYVLAASRLSADERVAGAAYLSYRQAGQALGQKFGPAELREWVAERELALLTLVGQLRTGRFDAWPAPPGHSRHGWGLDWRLVGLARVAERVPEEVSGE